jgi:hypothetical protein
MLIILHHLNLLNHHTTRLILRRLSIEIQKDKHSNNYNLIHKIIGYKA